MIYVIYNDETTILHRNKRSRKEWWETERAAKAERTRAGLDPDVWKIIDKDSFHDRIEVRERRKSIQGGWVTVTVNTPAYLDPSCESYWSM